MYKEQGDICNFVEHVSRKIFASRTAHIPSPHLKHMSKLAITTRICVPDKDIPFVKENSLANPGLFKV